ncbi:MAG: M48 family metallopeptidase [Patescibacteria group bacterium]
MKNVRYFGEQISLFISIVIILAVSLWFYYGVYWLFPLVIIFYLLYIVIAQKQLMGTSLLITEKQFPEIYKIIEENTEELNIKIPKVYITQDPYLNAYTLGFFKPYSIVINSAVIESFSRNEIDFIIGHEMGHIKYGHAKYLSLIAPLGKNIPVLSWIYGDWQRRSEYTSDRVGLLLTHDVKPAINVMIKLTVGNKLANNVDTEEVLKQIHLGKKGILAKTGEFFQTHPYTTNRMEQLILFNDFRQD